MPERRFPPPWSVEEPDPKLDRQCFIVRDANQQALAYVYFEDEPGARCHLNVMRGQLRFGLARSVGAACSCLVRTHPAAQAAKRCTKSSKPKRGRRPSVSK